MKEAIANAGVFNLIIIFVTILLLFFIGSLSYSKAFKVKNKIIDEIEKNQVYDEDVSQSIDNWLGEIGYRYNSSTSLWSCPKSNNGGILVNKASNYQYCVYEYIDSNKTRDINGRYYRVIAYMYFELPILSDLIKIPVMGETVRFVDSITS